MQKTTTLKCQYVENNNGIIVIYFLHNEHLFTPQNWDWFNVSKLESGPNFRKKIFLTFKLGREMQRKAKDKKDIRTFLKEKKWLWQKNGKKQNKNVYKSESDDFYIEIWSPPPLLPKTY